MRELTIHKTNKANEVLKINVIDEPGSGGASHQYYIFGFDTRSNPSYEPGMAVDSLEVLFQNGPIKEAGVNGITHEALLAILIDRLESFQAGPYQCAENAEALFNLYAALGALKTRTAKRVDRGIEGTHTV